MSKTTAANLEAKFDAGEDVSDYFDWSKATRPGLKKDRINLDLPQWIVDKLDRHARKAGVARQSLVKVWMVERLAQEESEDPTRQKAV
ncbi:MAG: CopG family antitoxin [Verrucomicrobia bacterium]|nr:CopG family antitoxin [Verrucomicrobiota bacterium]